MRDMIIRGFFNVIDRIGGPMTFRIILQPLMASIFAIIAGLKDAKAGRPPYLWTILTDPSQRYTLLHQGWKAIGRVFILAIVMDVIYQWMYLHWIYPLELIAVAILLAVIPYLLIRGPVSRIARRRRRTTVNTTAKAQ